MKKRGGISVEKTPAPVPQASKATKDISCRCYLSVLTELVSQHPPGPETNESYKVWSRRVRICSYTWPISPAMRKTVAA